jgi:glycosyltransferase involved in cell wall biosynthesis
LATISEKYLDRLRILQVIPTLAPSSGGPTQVLIDLAKSLSEFGHQVTVCTTDRGNPTSQQLSGDYFSELFSNSIEYYAFPVNVAPILYSRPMKMWIDRDISNYHIVHIHSLYRFPVTYAARRARRAGVPYIIRPHGSLDPFLYKQSQYNLLVKRIFERLFDIPNLHHAAAIHYTTKEEAERTKFLKLQGKPLIIPNGINPESFRIIPAKGLFRNRLGLNRESPLILFLGRINFKKGLNLLVPSFSIVAQAYPKARLAIVGPDNEGYKTEVRHWCREQGIEDKTFFVDYMGTEKVKQAYTDADVFVLPSYTENFGMTVVEAMACGCPVVISNQVNIWREVQAFGAGLSTELDPRAFADAIIQILKDKTVAREMGRLGRSAVMENYSWPNIAEQLIEVYRYLIDEKNYRKILSN